MPIGRQVLAGQPVLAAGKRDKYVTIQSVSESTTGGFPVETPTLLAKVWMSRTDLRADERFAANQESAFKETQWQMPYRADMDPDVVDVPKLRRLVYLNRVFDILSASIIGAKQGIELMTMAKVG